LNILDESRFRVGGLGVPSLLEALLVLVTAGLVFSLPFPKKSFAVEGWEDLTSCLIFEDEELGLVAVGFAGWGFVATAGRDVDTGGRRPVRRLTFLLIIVPYVEAYSRGSSVEVSSWICRVTSERT
jgi:hypothetical protein